MDPAAPVSMLVWRRRFGGADYLEVRDGKQWRLPRPSEIGLARSEVEGAVGFLAEAPPDFDPGRMHRWVDLDRGPEDVKGAFSQSGAAAIVWRRREGAVEVLLLHRSVNGPDYEGDWAWGPPGGALDPGETHAECAARELLEEAGLDVPLRRLTIANGFAAHVGELTGAADVVLSHEHDRFEWVAIDDACARCAPDVVADTLRAARTFIESP